MGKTKEVRAKEDRTDEDILAFYVDQRKFPWESEARCILRLLGKKPTKGSLVRISINGKVYRVFMDPTRSAIRPTIAGKPKHPKVKGKPLTPEEELARIMAKLPPSHPLRMSYEGRT